MLGLPYHDGPECLIYRRDLFAARGLRPPASWDEFHTLARCLSVPDENYAREIQQLFTIGLYMLNADGTRIFD